MHATAIPASAEPSSADSGLTIRGTAWQRVGVISSVRPSELDLTNWDLGGPVSEWSYRHAAELFETRRLAPGTRVSESSRAVDSKIPADLAEELGSGRVAAITILAGGRTVFRWPDGPTVPQLLMSVSKIIASLAIGLLADADKINYADPVRDVLPELGNQWQGCSVRHVLDMTSGVACPEVGDPGAYSDPGHPFYRFEASLGWRPPDRTTSPYELVLGYGRTGEPGTRYRYTSVNTFLLAWIVERVTDLSYVDALQRLIWDGLALAQDSALCVNRAGVPVAHGGLIMTVDDLARFGTMFTRTPGPNTLRVPDSYLEMLHDPRPELVAPTRSWPAEAHPGGQWNLIHPDGDLYKSGFGGQGLYVSPANDVVIAFGGVPDEHGRTHRLADKCRGLAVRFADSN